MTSAEIYAELTHVFHDVFQRRDLVLTPEMSAKDVPGWDSFMQIEIFLAVEARFAITLGIRDIDNLENVRDLAAIIATEIGAAPSRGDL